MRWAGIVLAIALLLVLYIPITNAMSINYFQVISERVPPGGWVTVYAEIADWDGSTCDIVFDNRILEEGLYPVYYSDIKTFRLVYMVQVPQDSILGMHTIKLKCGSLVESADIEVARPSMRVTPSSVAVGQEITVSITGMRDMLQTFILMIDDIPMMVFQPKLSNYTFTFTVPPLTSGNHTVNLYVTVDTFQNMVVAIETGAPSLEPPLIRGYFPNRLVLVSSAKFHVADGVPLSSEMQEAIQNSISPIESRLSNLESQVDTMQVQLTNKITNNVNMLVDKIVTVNLTLRSQLDNVNKTLSGKISSAENNIKSLQDDTASLKDQIQALKQANQDLQSKLENTTRFAYAALAIGLIGIAIGAFGLRKS